MRTYVRALGQPGVEREEQRRLPGYRDRRSCATSTRPRRSTPGSTRSTPSRPSTACRSSRGCRSAWTINPYRGCTHACHLLLRSPHAQVPRLQRRSRLRARDRRQGQRAGGAAGRAGAAVVEARARRAWARTPTRTSGSRGATGSCAGSGRRCGTPRNPCSVLTKSPLLLRDLDLLLRDRRARRVSAPTCRCRRSTRRRWRATEPHTPHPRARLEAVAELNRAGIPTGVLIAPLMPGHQRRPGARSSEILELADGGRGDAHRRHRAAPARRGARHLLRLAARPAARPRAALRAALPPRRLRAARPSASGCGSSSRSPTNAPRRRHPEARGRRARGFGAARRPRRGRDGARRAAETRSPARSAF